MRIKQIASLVCIVAVLSSCDAGSKPYLHHELAFKKLNRPCTELTTRFSMNSNINGERYEFEECLDVDFDKQRAVIERKGDTVVIRFLHQNAQRTLYNLTVDIDTWPHYHFLTIGNNTFSIIPSGN